MKWRNPISFLALAGATLLLAMFPFAPSRSWACSASSGSSFSHATQSDESSLTICAKSTTVSKSKTPAKPAPAKPAPPKPVVSKPVVSKPVVSKPVVSKPAPPKPVLPKVTPKPAPKPAPPKQVQAAPKPSPKPTMKTTQSTTILTAEARFSPAAAPISASNLSPALGELVEFRALAATHFKTASILGRLAEVKFTPIAIDWNFGPCNTIATVGGSQGGANKGSEINKLTDRKRNCLQREAERAPDLSTVLPRMGQAAQISADRRFCRAPSLVNEETNEDGPPKQAVSPRSC